MKKHHAVGLIAGGTVFVINMVENIVHYSIGKQNGSGKKFKLSVPTGKEILLMVGTSIVAGVIAGYITKKYIESN